ncbi:uncharacterized protein BDV17DRAFT_279920 [Aspergillus undulatus]|uniref:uncharacterized protein n=1 Tax=Aspergillus undulatus TaxID=1810928 RepID=UPI003CCCA3E7
MPSHLLPKMPQSKSLLIPLIAAGYALAETTQILDQGYYAFGTQSNGAIVPVARSDDSNSWTLLDGTDALPNPFPSWIQGRQSASLGSRGDPAYDAIAPDGDPVTIFDRDDGGADGDLVDTPSLVKVSGTYCLSFSSNSNVGPLGGPGGSYFLDDGSKIAFHAFIDGQSIDSGRGCGLLAFR